MFVGSRYFLLFLLYSVTASNMVTFDMLHLLTHQTLPAGATFFLVEGECLSMLLSGVLTPFFMFHVWLTSNNMTTIEFCEKKGLEEFSRCFMRKLWWLEMVNFIEVLEHIGRFGFWDVGVLVTVNLERIWH